MAYTQNFSEVHKLLAAVSYDGVSSEQNLVAFLDISNYRRVEVIIITDAVGTDFNADIEVSEVAAGTSPFTLMSMTQATADEGNYIFEIRDEQLSKPSAASGDQYRYLNVETTPDGTCNYVVLVFGSEPRYAPVSATEWDEIITTVNT